MFYVRGENRGSWTHEEQDALLRLLEQRLERFDRYRDRRFDADALSGLAALLKEELDIHLSRLRAETARELHRADVPSWATALFESKQAEDVSVRAIVTLLDLVHVCRDEGISLSFAGD